MRLGTLLTTTVLWFMASVCQAKKIDFVSELSLGNSLLISDHLEITSYSEAPHLNGWVCFEKAPADARVRCTDVIRDLDGTDYAFFDFEFRRGKIKYSFVTRRQPRLEDCNSLRVDINQVLATKGPICIAVEIPGSTVESESAGATITTKLVGLKSKESSWEGYP